MHHPGRQWLQAVQSRAMGNSKRPGAGRAWLLLTACVAGMAPWPALAGQYEALCGGTKCTVVVSPAAISSPYGSIPPKRVTYWGFSGESKTSVGTGVTTTILFGGLGLLGFLAKNHQYNFTVNGFDSSGRAVTMQFEFKNDRPAKSMMQEMVGITGLGIGQTRSVEDIRAAESGEQQGPGAMPSRSSTINTLGPAPASLR